MPGPTLAILGALLVPLALTAQRPDTAQALPELRVAVSRGALTPGAAGLAVTVLDSGALGRGRPLPALDDALALVPGVVIRDRGDPTQDPRLSIRGAGARANFGVRSVQVLVDGVPATLPDGQTPLTAADLLTARRIEVARGPLAALHGNGSLGVVAIETASRLEGRWGAQGGVQAGSDATATWHAVAGGGGGRAGGLLAASRTTTDGWREHAAGEQLRVRAAMELRAADNHIVTLRANHADDPALLSPGALTLAEYRSDPRQANPNSVRRNAGKTVEQSSLSLDWKARPGGGARTEVTTWLLRRDLENPIAAPAPAPADPEEGVWIGIDRRVAGIRASLTLPIGGTAVLLGGVDAQRMADDRVNRRHRAGVVNGPAFLDQREVITELGPFLQLHAPLGGALSARGGVRHDRVAFSVDDRIDPAAGGSRTMAAWSASAAVSWQRSSVEAWLGGGSAFETPTTTELANRPDGGTGLNTVLDPARTLSMEAGARWRGANLDAEAVVWRAATRDAITAISEVGGRSFFANVGRTTTRGVELALVARAGALLTVRGSATWGKGRFGDDAVAADGASIRENAVPGVFPFTARLVATARPSTLVIDFDHAWSSGTWADDANTLRIDGWGAGVTNLHIRWDADARIALLAGLRNVFDVRHVAGVVVNGGFGRVAEPGRPRSVMIGGEIALAANRGA